MHIVSVSVLVSSMYLLYMDFLFVCMWTIVKFVSIQKVTYLFMCFFFKSSYADLYEYLL